MTMSIQQARAIVRVAQASEVLDATTTDADWNAGWRGLIAARRSARSVGVEVGGVGSQEHARWTVRQGLIEQAARSLGVEIIPWSDDAVGEARAVLDRAALAAVVTRATETCAPQRRAM